MEPIHEKFARRRKAVALAAFLHGKGATVDQVSRLDPSGRRYAEEIMRLPKCSDRTWQQVIEEMNRLYAIDAICREVEGQIREG